MKAQPVYYHGTNNAEKAKATGLMAGKNDNEYLANNFGTGIYLTETPENALRYGEVLSVLPKKKLKLRKLSNNEIIEIEFAEAKEKEEILDSMIAEDDYDGIKIKREDGEIEIVIFDDKLLDKPIDKITKFQLTYIYNQATKETRQEIEDETNRVIFPENYK